MVWLEILGDRNPEILLLAAKAVCSHEEFPSTAVVDKWYRRIAAERRDALEVLQIESIEDKHQHDPDAAAEAIKELKRMAGVFEGGEE